MDEHFSINPDVVERDGDHQSRDPFSDEWAGGAYLNDAFKLNLNKLIHLAPYSEVLFVSGAEGIGKSTLLQQFAIGAKKSWRVIALQGSSLMTSEEFLRQVVHGFGLPAAGVDDVEDMLVEIGRHLQALGRSGRRAILVIDDVHLLKDEVMVMIEQILGDGRSTNAISLVFAADEAGTKCLEHFPVLLNKVAYILPLEPLDEAGTAGYIAHRLVESGNSGAQTHFDAPLTRQLHHKSGGLPGRINALARRHLGKGSGLKGAAGLLGDGRKLVRWGAVVVGVAAIGAVLLFQERINHLVQTPANQGEKVTELAVPAIEETQVVSEIPVPEAPKVAEEGVSDSPPITGLSMGALAEQAEGRSDAQAPAVVPEPPQPEPQTPTPAKPQSVATPAAKVLPPESAAISKPESVPVPVPKVLPVPAASKESVVAKTESKPKPAPKEPEKPKGEATAGWLHSQNSQHFTLQLMALLDEAEVKRFVKSHKLEGKSEIFTITRKGKQLTALVYGSYPDRAAVDEAAKALPKEWGVKDPWPRTFASVVDDIKAN